MSWPSASYILALSRVMLARTLAHQWLYWNQLQSMELYSHQFFSFFELSVADALRKDVTLKTFPARQLSLRRASHPIAFIWF